MDIEVSQTSAGLVSISSDGGQTADEIMESPSPTTEKKSNGVTFAAEDSAPYDEGEVDPESALMTGGQKDADEEEAMVSKEEFSNEHDEVDAYEEDYSEDAADDAEAGVPLSSADFTGDYSLKAPPSTVRFRGKTYKVYEQRNSQFILEERTTTSPDGKQTTKSVVARTAKDGSVGLSFLRVLYTILSLLMAGFLLIFCLQVLLFLILDIAGRVGLTSEQDFNFARFFGSLLAAPLLVYSLAMAMAIATAFVGDTWNGSPFINMFVSWEDVKPEWTTFSVYLGIPLFTMIICLFAQTDEWWSITAITWFSLIFALYCVFAAFVVYYELMGTYELVKRIDHCPYEEGWQQITKFCILTIQKLRFSGLEYSHHLEQDGVDAEDDRILLSDKSTRSLYSKITSKLADTKFGERMFRRLDTLNQSNPNFAKDKTLRRILTVDEVRDTNAFVTKESWSLEKLYCRNRNSRFVAVVDGDAALTEEQIRSSFACAILGSVIVVLLATSLLVWAEAPGGVVAVVVVACALFLYPKFKSYWSNYQAAQAIRREKRSGGKGNLYQVWEMVRVTEPTPQLSWVLFGLEVVFLYVLPLIALYTGNNWKIALLFMVMGFVSGVRFYYNPAIILREVKGGLHNLNDEGKEEEDFREKSRLSLIISKISQGPRRNVWIWVFGVILFLFTVILYGAYELGTSEGKEEASTYLPPDQYSYPTKSQLAYPTCRMGNGLELAGSADTALADYAFLSFLAYKSPDVTQELLDGWFGKDNDGNSIAVDYFEEVNDYKSSLEKKSSVSYKLIGFPSTDQTAVAIRGTNNGWDALSDAQLWSAAALAVWFVQSALPFGEVFAPIQDSLVRMVSLIESDQLEEVAYYKETTDFVSKLKTGKITGPNNLIFKNLRITGHSLGGGLSMISGTQTETPAIALSGPNNSISRKTFDPELSLEALDKYTFNIVPDRDPVPRIDRLSQLYQRIHCEAPANNPAACHSSDRSVCEILYTCGSQGRPIPCFCMGGGNDYPRPDFIGDGDDPYDEICKKQLQ